MGRTFYYKGLEVNAFGIPVDPTRKTRIKKSKRQREFYYITFESDFKKNAPKNLIVMYDIPESKKKERDWFRRQLKSFHYIMIQRSVWVGPSPLPKKFLEYVKFIGLKKQLRTFKLAKSYVERESKI